MEYEGKDVYLKSSAFDFMINTKHIVSIEKISSRTDDKYMVYTIDGKYYEISAETYSTYMNKYCKVIY